MIIIEAKKLYICYLIVCNLLRNRFVQKCMYCEDLQKHKFAYDKEEEAGKG